MLKNLLVLVVIAAPMATAGCGGAATTNTVSSAAAKTQANTAPTQTPSYAAPVISTANTTLPKGATPTPGIPDPATLKKAQKPGATPTPGIPSQAELRKFMSQPPPDVNAKPPGTAPVPIMKNSNKILRRP